jgi:hypothetical protein
MIIVMGVLRKEAAMRSDRPSKSPKSKVRETKVLDKIATSRGRRNFYASRCGGCFGCYRKPCLRNLKAAGADIGGRT